MKRWISTAFVLGAFLSAGCATDRSVMSDASITAEVERQLSDAHVIGAIEPSTASGMVTLTGSVPDSTAKMKAEDVAQRVPGVSRVQNNLRVVAAADAPDRPAVNLPPHPPAEKNAPPEPEIR